MDALDLSQRPPRSPRLLLADLELLVMARTVDKLRATLPGGNLGVYQIDGLSSRLLDALGISQGALRDVVARAASDADVASWIGENSDSSRYEAINVALEERKVQDRLDDPKFLERYPIAKGVPPDTKLLDFLVLDDLDMFGGST
jgi:hypothetical protein